MRADEAVYVPLFVESSHAAIGDDLVAVSALGTELKLVAALAVRLAGEFEEVSSTERVVAGTAHEVLRVIRTSKRLHAFIVNRLTAMIADTTRLGTSAT